MIYLIHGFNVKNPSNTVGKLRRYLHSHSAYMFNYGWRFFSVLWHNRVDAKNLASLIDKNIDPETTLIGHSNGCAIAVEAARQGAIIDTLILINPALKIKTKFPHSALKILVIHTKHDKATRAARFFDKVPLLQLLVPNAWGAMGAKGYKGDDIRVTNWDLSKDLNGHSDFFSDDNLERFMPKIIEYLKQ